MKKLTPFQTISATITPKSIKLSDIEESFSKMTNQEKDFIATFKLGGRRMFDTVIKRMNEYLLEDRMMQKESNKLHESDPELARQLFQQHLKLRSDVKKMHTECEEFIASFLNRWKQI